MNLIKHIIKKVNDYNCKHGNHIYEHVNTNVNGIKCKDEHFIEVCTQCACKHCRYTAYIITRFNKDKQTTNVI